MHRKFLKESFSWETIKHGNEIRIYINEKLSEPNFYFKDVIKSYGGKYDPMRKTWYFVVSSNKEERDKQIETQIKPCVQYLKNNEKKKGNVSYDDTMKEILSIIDKLINAPISTSGVEEVDTLADPKEITDRLKKYKQELIAAFNSEEWKTKFLPIIKFRNAHGPDFSINNAILIKLQDPESTLVKSRTNWKKSNKDIKEGAPCLYGWRPVGPKKYNTYQKIRLAKIEWLKGNGKIKDLNPSNTSINLAISKLTVGEREMLDKELNTVEPVIGYEIAPMWYDIRFTIQIENTEDLIGSNDSIDDVEWCDEKSPVTEKTTKLYDCITKMITDDFHIKLKYVPSGALGTAKGVSKSGVIEVPVDVPKNAGGSNTLIHELSHELLHQKYLKNYDKEYAKYFIGTDQPKGPIEQQAEISAWIVMRNFGFNMETSVNYAGCWGADDRACVIVFDTVSNVASRIIKNLTLRFEGKQVNENFETSSNIITGEEVANLCGFGDLYRKMKVRQQFNEMFNRINNATILK